MHTPVLVLDDQYMPIARTSWQEAFTLYFLGKVEILAEYEDKFIHSVSITWKMPAIIRYVMKASSRSRRKRVVKFSRANIYDRDGGKCCYCGKGVSREKATFDHVVPKVLGGISIWTNVVIACFPCNQRKAGRTPDQASMPLRTIPKKPPDISTHLILTIMRDPKSPKAWKDFLATYRYWNTELDK